MSNELIVDGLFEARLTRENKSARGIFITLEIAADDYYAARLSDVRPGALLKIGYQELRDSSVQPIEQTSGPVATGASTAAPQSGEETAAPSKPRRRFDTLPLSQQCAMRCGEKRFQEWLNGRDSGEENAAKSVRAYCGVKSRSEIDTNGAAREYWNTLEQLFQQWLLETEHADLAR